MKTSELGNLAKFILRKRFLTPFLLGFLLSRE